MGIFSRKKQVIQVEPEAHSIQFTRDAVVVESTDMELAQAIIMFWEEHHGAEKASGKPSPKIGFSKDHMSDLESDVDHAGRGEAPEDDFDEDEGEEVDEGVY